MKIRVNLKQLRTGLLILLLILVSVTAGWKWRDKQGQSGLKIDRSQPTSKAEIDLSLFWQVWDRLHETYLIKEDLKSVEMVWGAIKGMTAALGDRYTVFLPPEQNKAVKEELNGSFEGVGIQLGFKEERLAVIAPLAGMPAEAVGVRAGDLILRIKDETKEIDVDTVDMSLPEAVKIIRGPKGSRVSLSLLHDGETEPVEVEITRDTIIVKSVELKFGRTDSQGSWVDETQACGEESCQNVTYLRLSRFGGRTEQEWQGAVDKILTHQGQVAGVVLDMRNNPGGYLQGAVYYAEEFLEKGLFVVKQEDAQGGIETYSVKRSGRMLDQPLVVLINQGSASSSEILAGALQDHGRAKLVGVKSFGKGTIQEAVDVGEGAGLHVTSAKWLLPSGNWVNETGGLEPDVMVEFDSEKPEADEQLMEAIKLLVNL